MCSSAPSAASSSTCVAEACSHPSMEKPLTRASRTVSRRWRRRPHRVGRLPPARSGGARARCSRPRRGGAALRQAALRQPRRLYPSRRDARGRDGCAGARGALQVRAAPTHRAGARHARPRRPGKGHAEEALCRRSPWTWTRCRSSRASPRPCRRPRLHTVRYAEVLAPASKLRARIVPKPIVAPEPLAGESPEPKEAAAGSRYRPWAELLKRCFSIDVLTCTGCGGRMRLVALVTEPASVRRFLRGLGETTDAPARAPARGPPYWKSRVLRRDETSVA
jgi:hypothetical protein